jgi:hypothetical protein
MTWQTFDSAGALITKPGLPSYVTSLPSTPADGTEVYYAADATNGVIWHLRYRSSSSSSYKWEFIGGSPLWHEIATNETCNSTTFVDLATVGPSVTVPLAGDYVLRLTVNTDAGSQATIIAPKIGSAATSDNDRLAQSNVGTIAAGGQSVKTGISANTVVKIQYRCTSGTASVAFRRFQVTPIRVG